MHEFANKVSALTGVSHKEAVGFVKVIPLEYRNYALIALNDGTTIEQVRYIFTDDVLAEAWIRDYVNRTFVEKKVEKI